MESKEELVEFTAAVPTRIVAEDGTLCMNFEAGESRLVPKKLHTPAMQSGLVPESRLEAPSPPPAPLPTKEEIIEEGLLEACKTLIMRANPNDFTAIHGTPRVASLQKLVDFDFKAADAKKAFERAMFEVEQDANNSTEHSEPSSDATE